MNGEQEVYTLKQLFTNNLCMLASLPSHPHKIIHYTELCDAKNVNKPTIVARQGEKLQKYQVHCEGLKIQ